MRTISPEVTDVLRRSNVSADRVVLPAGQLDRKLYEQVNRVLIDYGGKWSKRDKAHIFPTDPRELLSAALTNGKSVNQQQISGSFYTPAHIIDQMIVHARLSPGMAVLEPSAGDGRIAIACRDKGCMVQVCEIDATKAELLESLGFNKSGRDFLDTSLAAVYDRVLMNPPFAKGQDVQHVFHAFEFLKAGGILVAITSTGWTFRSDKRSVGLREFVAECGTWYELPENTFRDEGTGVKTAMVVLRN